MINENEINFSPQFLAQNALNSLQTAIYRLFRDCSEDGFTEIEICLVLGIPPYDQSVIDVVKATLAILHKKKLLVRLTDSKKWALNSK